ncbi:MAG: 50S ribosomal protein L35 [Omnitrophica bacterium RIFCSPHIGHO2_02_FULL_49_9]|nr:MAG: 50S ribosomal protein L35 [Omnitrophica bacterium RIFCSPHIGHO2_02_FULL_49_9]
MPKLKTNKATKKRFKITATKKVLASKTKRRHLLGDRNASKKRRFRKKWVLEPTDRKAIIQSLPYGV